MYKLGILLLAQLLVSATSAYKPPTKFSVYVSETSPSFKGQPIGACNGTFVVGKPYCGAKYRNGKKYTKDVLFLETKGQDGGLANNYRTQPYFIAHDGRFAYTGYFPAQNRVHEKFQEFVPGDFTFGDRPFMACPSDGSIVSKDYMVVYAEPEDNPPADCKYLQLKTKQRHYKSAFAW